MVKKIKVPFLTPKVFFSFRAKSSKKQWNWPKKRHANIGEIESKIEVIKFFNFLGGLTFLGGGGKDKEKLTQ